jgi:hypothetical protein
MIRMKYKPAKEAQDARGKPLFYRLFCKVTVARRLCGGFSGPSALLLTVNLHEAIDE